MTEKIVVLDPISQERADELRELLPEGFILECGRGFSDEDLKVAIADADYAISGQIGVSGDVLRSATRLKLLHKWGVGVDNLDLLAARELGIKVARTTGSNALSVAEYTIGLIITVLRGIGYGHHHLKGGDWRGITKLPTPTYQLSGKKVGIIGFGAIGQNVARLLKSFDAEVLYAKRSALPSQSEFHNFAKRASIDEIIETADIICLHCPLTEETKNLIGEKEL
ncbi:MAG: NAD(P)-dependent oxidoreductase, partial [Alphaproteobacteria bacterium]